MPYTWKQQKKKSFNFKNNEEKRKADATIQYFRILMDRIWIKINLT